MDGQNDIGESLVKLSDPQKNIKGMPLSAHHKAENE
jgi:hypothetical protein